MSDSEEKTEKPSQRKLKEARKKGEVAQSKELTGAIGFIAAFLLLWLGAAFLQGKLRRVLDAALVAIGELGHGDSGLEPSSPAPWPGAALEEMAISALWVVVPVLAVVAVVGLLAAFTQTRGVFSTEPLKFKFENMNPGKAIEKVFSTRQLGVLVQMILKLGLLAAVTVLTVKRFIGPMILSIHGEAGNTSLAGVSALEALFGGCGIVFVSLGAIDFLHQHFEHLKKNRMSKTEVKRERKDQDGDPHLRSALRAQRREILDAPVRLGVARASVVVTNPTHFAVALFYDGDVVELPVVVAKGQDDAAFAMRREAGRAGVPVLESPPLARALFAGVGLGEAIGDEHVDAVAEVFRWLGRLKADGARTTS